MWLLRLYHLLVEMYFYSHIPCGMWLFLRKYWYAGDKFLLTHPVWDVTTLCPLLRSSTMNFYSHIPCGMWPSPELYVVASETFLLTHPVWDVTLHPVCPYIAARYFYSHIPCGMWPELKKQNEKLKHFYSHIPCGMWQMNGWGSSMRKWFLLTHPVWDVTRKAEHKRRYRAISTHTSRVGCDSCCHSMRVLSDYFYSHIPCGMWPVHCECVPVAS